MQKFNAIHFFRYLKTAAAFKAGKIASNPFQSNAPGGAMIPPPTGKLLSVKCYYVVP